MGTQPKAALGWGESKSVYWAALGGHWDSTEICTGSAGSALGALGPVVGALGALESVLGVYWSYTQSTEPILEGILGTLGVYLGPIWGQL